MVKKNKKTNSLSFKKLNAFLGANFDIETTIMIQKIMLNVSYSREKKNLMDPLEGKTLYFRNVVSDADKIDAIGLGGLMRCFSYQVEMYGGGEAESGGADKRDIFERVYEHCGEKLCKLLPDFIRTGEREREEREREESRVLLGGDEME